VLVPGRVLELAKGLELALGPVLALELEQVLAWARRRPQ
jgi:hypothetical protein